MPQKPKKLCSHPGCSVVADGRFCLNHVKAERKYQDDKRGTSTQRGYDARWRKVRETVLAKYPLCQMCRLQNKLVPATLVHHIKAIGSGGSVLDVSNMMSLCTSCHDDIHREQGDKW